MKQKIHSNYLNDLAFKNSKTHLHQKEIDQENTKKHKFFTF